MKKFPQLQYDLDKIIKNAKVIKKLCNENGIDIAAVVKGVNGDIEISRKMVDVGFTELGSSRISQLKNIKEEFNVETFLLRIPMESELDDLVKWVDISLQSELFILKKTASICRREKKKHKVILMVDLGDLREGFISEKELYETANFVEKNKYLELKGIGTNLGCYGSIKPTNKNLSVLVKYAEYIEDNIINRKLEVISGGATSSLTLLYDNKMPKRINHLRIGEGILLARDLTDYWGYKQPNLCKKTMKLEAQIIEIKDKPSYPVGEIYIDAFGNKPIYKDKGIRKKALLGIGKRDFGHHDKLIPLNKNIVIIGSSSDHLIIDITDCEKEISISDTFTFYLYYEAMLYASGSDDIIKKYINQI